MARTVEYHLKGKSDVEQVTGRAQKSMSQLNTTMTAVNKKFSEIGKDLFMRFLAPVVLIDKAVNLLIDSIKKMRETAKDGIENLTENEGILLSPDFQASAAHIKRILKARETSDVQNEELRRLTVSIFEETEAGKQYLDELRKKHFMSFLFNPAFASHQMAMDPEVQIEAARRVRASMGSAAPKEPQAKKDFKLEATGGNVIGVGQSAVVLAVQESNDLLRQIVTNTTPFSGVLNPTGALSKADGEAAVRMMSTGVGNMPRLNNR